MWRDAAYNKVYTLFFLKGIERRVAGEDADEELNHVAVFLRADLVVIFDELHVLAMVLGMVREGDIVTLKSVKKCCNIDVQCLCDLGEAAG